MNAQQFDSGGTFAVDCLQENVHNVELSLIRHSVFAFSSATGKLEALHLECREGISYLTVSKLSRKEALQSTHQLTQ